MRLNKKKKSFLLGHLFLALPFIAGYSHAALTIFLVMYVIKAFGMSIGHHRYFAHKSFKTSRTFQFIIGLFAMTTNQRGPLWWSSYHRHHHMTSDTEKDYQSPRHGVWQSHFGWLLEKELEEMKPELVEDLAAFPEMQFLEKYHLHVFFMSGLVTTLLGVFLGYAFPALETNGFQFFSWGFVLSTFCANHMTMSTASLLHLFGSRRYETSDTSKNLWWHFPALGEQWHNNHHKYPSTCNSGHLWYEYDCSYYFIRVLASLGLVWDLRVVKYEKGRPVVKTLYKKIKTTNSGIILGGTREA